MPTNSGDSVTAPDQPPTLDANELDRVLAKVIHDYEDSIASSDSPALAKFRVERRFLVGRLKELRSSLASLLADSENMQRLLRFAGMALDDCRAGEIGDWDGGAIQDAMEKCGLLEPVRVTAPCDPEDCRCAEYADDFPTTCYRFSDLALRAIRVAASPADKAQLENPSAARSPVSGTTDT